MSSYLPLSWSDRCLGPPYIWVRCGKREPRPGSGKGSCFWRLVLSVSGGKGTTEGKISVLTAFLCLYSKLLLSQTLVWLSFSNTNWIKPHCVWQHELRWEVPFFGLKKKKKKPPVTRLWHHQEVETSMGWRSSCHMTRWDPIEYC